MLLAPWRIEPADLARSLELAQRFDQVFRFPFLEVEIFHQFLSAQWACQRSMGMVEGEDKRGLPLQW